MVNLSLYHYVSLCCDVSSISFPSSVISLYTEEFLIQADWLYHVLCDQTNTLLAHLSRCRTTIPHGSIGGVEASESGKPGVVSPVFTIFISPRRNRHWLPFKSDDASARHFTSYSPGHAKKSVDLVRTKQLALRQLGCGGAERWWRGCGWRGDNQPKSFDESQEKIFGWKCPLSTARRGEIKLQVATPPHAKREALTVGVNLASAKNHWNAPFEHLLCRCFGFCMRPATNLLYLLPCSQVIVSAYCTIILYDNASVSVSVVEAVCDTSLQLQCPSQMHTEMDCGDNPFDSCVPENDDEDCDESCSFRAFWISVIKFFLSLLFWTRFSMFS